MRIQNQFTIPLQEVPEEKIGNFGISQIIEVASSFGSL